MRQLVNSFRTLFEYMECRIGVIHCASEESGRLLDWVSSGWLAGKDDHHQKIKGGLCELLLGLWSPAWCLLL
jgi:hypothetical protein